MNWPLSPLVARHTRFALPSLLGASLLGGCPIDEVPEVPAERPVLPCSTDAQCTSEQKCLPDPGYCVDGRALQRSLLLEITPQLADAAYAGARFFVQLPPEPDRGPLSESRPVWVPPLVNVRGSIAADPTQPGCADIAQQTLPARLRFIPVQTQLGLNAPAFAMQTIADPDTGQFLFEGRIPPGTYDVYIRPDTRQLGEQCLAVPQIYRSREVQEGVALLFEQPELTPLSLSFSWEDDALDGWTLDVVDSSTGQLISNEVTLRSDQVQAAANRLDATVIYSTLEGAETPAPSELVRLHPPEGQIAGTVLIVRTGLVVGADGRAPVGELSLPTNAVQLRAWAWDQTAQPAMGTVEFSARALDEAGDVTTAFSVTAATDRQGQVSVSLLPGQYRVRNFPAVAHRGASSRWSGSQQDLRVYGDVPVQAAQRLAVAPSMNLSGRVTATSAAGETLAVRRAALWATPSFTDGTGCLRQPDNYGQLATADCDSPLAPVLSRALARDPFTPRNRVAPVDSSGIFELTGLDCGACSDGLGATFDLTVRPEASTGLAWSVRTRQTVRPQSERAPEFSLSAPIHQALRVAQAPEASADEEPASDSANSRPLAGARLRAFVVLDEDLSPTNDLHLPPCRPASDTPAGGCLRTAIQVAEGRSDPDGQWHLLFPAESR